MSAELTARLARKHDTVMIEKSKDGRGKGTILASLSEQGFGVVS
jgi:hypothetical protein